MLARKARPIFCCYINERAKGEWMTREYGSFEDSKCADTHVHEILSRSRNRYVDAYTIEQLRSLSESAAHCCTWQNGDTDSDRYDVQIEAVSKKLKLALKEKGI